MAVQTVCYCSRTDVLRAADFTDGSLTVTATDRAIQSSAHDIEGALHRRFWPEDRTVWDDYPPSQPADPWTWPMQDWDFVALTAVSSGGVAIPLGNVFPYPLNPAPGYPWRWIELDRSASSTFGGGPTPQAARSATGTFGFTAKADQAATLAADITDSQVTITVTDSSQISAGDLLIVGYGRGSADSDDPLPHASTFASYTGERVLVTDTGWYDTGDTQSGSGCSTAASSDNVLTASGGTFYTGEVLLLDDEEMLITNVTTAGLLIVGRAFNSTVLATHSDAGIYAARSLTVDRGYAGTTAAAATEGTGVFKHRVPGLIRDLAIAESVNRLLQETAGYARTVGSGDSAIAAPGAGLADLWSSARAAYGRAGKGRVRVV